MYIVFDASYELIGTFNNLKEIHDALGVKFTKADVGNLEFNHGKIVLTTEELPEKLEEIYSNIENEVVAGVSQRLDECGEEIVTKKMKIRTLERSIANLENDLSEMTGQRDGLQKDKENLQYNLEGVTKELEDTEGELETAKNRIIALEDAVLNIYEVLNRSKFADIVLSEMQIISQEGELSEEDNEERPQLQRTLTPAKQKEVAKPKKEKPVSKPAPKEVEEGAGCTVVADVYKGGKLVSGSGLVDVKGKSEITKGEVKVDIKKDGTYDVRVGGKSVEEAYQEESTNVTAKNTSKKSQGNKDIVDFVKIVKDGKLKEIKDVLDSPTINVDKLAALTGLTAIDIEYILHTVIKSLGTEPTFKNKKLISNTEALLILVSSRVRSVNGKGKKKRIVKATDNCIAFYDKWVEQKDEIAELLSPLDLNNL